MRNDIARKARQKSHIQAYYERKAEEKLKALVEAAEKHLQALREYKAAKERVWENDNERD